MKIFDILFGKKKTLNHAILGILKSQRIKGNNKTKTYSWYGSVTLSNHKEETVIILEGNNITPCSSHLESINDLVKNWDTKYLSLIEEKITNQKINQERKFSNWKKDFYVGAITPMDEKKPEFELTFEPLDENENDFIGIEIKNNLISKVEIYK